MVNGYPMSSSFLVSTVFFGATLKLQEYLKDIDYLTILFPYIGGTILVLLVASKVASGLTNIWIVAGSAAEV
jgi:hypothetical protein